MDRDFLLDSGASGILVSDSVARELFPDTLLWRDVKLSGIKGNINGSRLGRLSLNLGGRPEVFPSALTVPDWDTVTPHHWGIGGTLGYELFARYVVRIDFKTLTLRLIPPKGFKYSGAGIVLPMRVGNDRMPRIHLGLNFKDGPRLDGEFIVDTGSDEGALVTEGQFALPASRGNERETPGRSTATIGAAFATREFPLVSLSLGQTVWPFPALTVLARPEGRDGRGRLSGIVGTKFLSLFGTVILDYRRRELILERNEPLASETESAVN
jgi:hypothetical protein